MARCRVEACGQEIDFITLRSGRMMPVEGREPEEYRVSLEKPTTDPRGLEVDERADFMSLQLVTPDGDVLAVWQAWAINPTGRRRRLDGPCRVVAVESHFATCVGAAEQRRA